jgi:hypothetical protein
MGLSLVSAEDFVPKFLGVQNGPRPKLSCPNVELGNETFILWGEDCHENKTGGETDEGPNDPTRHI